MTQTHAHHGDPVLVQHSHPKRVPTVAHVHWKIKQWEAKTSAGVLESLRDAQMRIWVQDIGEPDYSIREVVHYSDAAKRFGIPIQVSQNGDINVYQQQRIGNGLWAKPTVPLAIPVVMEYPAKPAPPEIMVGENDGKEAQVEAHFDWIDFTVTGKTFRPSGGFLEVLNPLADSEDGWEKVVEVEYAANEDVPTSPIKAEFVLPVYEGRATWNARWTVVNLCDLDSDPSDVTDFEISNVQPQTSGTGGFDTHCPHL